MYLTVLITTLACPNYFVCGNWVSLAAICISVHYNGAELLHSSKFRCACKFRASSSFRLRSGNTEMSLACFCSCFMLDRARETLYTKCQCACVEYRTYSLFASSISTVPENTVVNQRDWKHNPEIIARYVKVYLMQLRSTFYPTNLLFLRSLTLRINTIY